MTEYATKEFDKPEKYIHQWQTNWWKITENFIDDKESDEKYQISNYGENN